MTNCIDKQKLMAALDQTREGLEMVKPTCELLANMGAREALATNQAYLLAVSAIQAGILAGNFDCEDELVLTVYTEDEDLDTEDMDDYAPEEESRGQQDEFVGGIVILDPHTSPEDRAELVEFYRSLGMDVQ